jgi:peptidoglycan hydrolase-like protein with peptidoglycan-binding domain
MTVARAVSRVLLSLAGAATGLAGAMGPARGQEAAGTDTSGRLQVLAEQCALEAAGFSPGLLDGLPGPKTEVALHAFQRSLVGSRTGNLDRATAAALGLSDEHPATATYVITMDDGKEVGACPTDWLERSQLPRLVYPTLTNLLAEKFHTSERCLAWLNPEKDLHAIQPGDAVIVPAIPPAAARPLAERLEIDLERKLILILGAADELQGILHCSVARDLDLVARGETSVSTVVIEPDYTFDPKKWPEVNGIDRKLRIPPGPRCPVGLRWIGLDRPGVGIHGTPEPENIGKTGSHGCFRLTNWDAIRLASVVRVGTPVRIVDRSKLAALKSGRSDAAPDSPGLRR